MKRITPQPRIGSKSSKPQTTFSDLLRSTRRHSAYAFVAGLGIWLPKAHAATLINLDSTTGYSSGPLNTWNNTGTVVGNFDVPGGSAIPAVTNVDGVTAIAFLAAGAAAGTSYVGPVAPANVSSNNVRTFEAWIWDTARLAGNTVFTWGRRAEPLNEAIGHGTAAFGMAGHFGAFDFAYGSASDVVVGAWTYITYTYDGTNCAVYVDGTLRNARAVGKLNTAQVASDNVTPVRFRVARQTANAGTISGADLGNFFAARLRVKDTVMTSAEILAQYNAEKGDLGYKDSDGDGMADWWESRFGLNPNDATGANGASGDPDGDGANNLKEFQALSNPNAADTDGDGISDGAELNRIDPQTSLAAPTNPAKFDTDDDGLSDGAETDTGAFVSASNTGTDPLNPDADGDTYSDGVEVGRGTNPFSAASFPNPIISLDATGLPLGALPIWTNAGTLPGNFTSVSATNRPTVQSFDAVKGVRFTTVGGGGANGTSYYGPAVPVGITGAGPRTADMWVYNPTAQNEETMLAWGARDFNPNTGANVSFGEGRSVDFGAVAQWGGPDIPWNNQDVYGRWVHLAYTYDGTTTRVYRDGVLANSEVLPLVTAATAPADGLPYHFRIARQNDGNDTNPAGSATSGAATGGATGIDGAGAGDFTMAKVRVFDFFEDGPTILARFNSEKAAFGLSDTDGDGLPDWWEIRFGLNPNDSTGANGASGNSDADGLTNLQEYNVGTAIFPGGTSPLIADTDADGLNDGAEVNRINPLTLAPAPTNPLVADTDADALKDGVETGTGIFVSVSNTGTDPLKVDTDGDTFSDGLEVAQGSNPVDPLSIPSPLPIINLDATTNSIPLGPLNVWTNTGRAAGNFDAEAGGGSANVGGNIESIQGVRGLTLNGGSYRGPGATFVTGNPNYSVEAWVYNPAIGDEETIIGWGRRGGGDGTMSAFTDGSNGTWGAMTHWGAPDLTWNGANVRTPTRWKYLVYTYDAALQTQIVYSDGVEANREVLGSPLIIVDSLDGGLTHLPFRVGNETGDTGNPAGFAGTMTIGEIRIYTRVLPPSEITTAFNTGAQKYGILDTDGDGMPDWYERTYSSFLNPTNAADGALDFDNDGLLNALEYQYGTDPTKADSDGDGLTDGAEINTYNSNPTNPDSDLDGLPDSRELALGTFPSVGGQDSDGDGFVDSMEVIYGSNPTNAASVPVTSTPVPYVNLDATGLAVGPLVNWTNLNALGWNFAAPTNAIANVEVVDGTKGVRFFGTNHYVGPTVPSFFAGDATRSVEAWILNPGPAVGEETVFAWGARGTDGRNSAFAHGTDAGFGALQFWGGDADVPWGANAAAIAANVVTSRWTHVAYTYDNVNKIRACYHDGVFAFAETNATLVLNTFLYDPSDPLNTPQNNFGRALPFRVGAQSTALGAFDAGAARPTLTIAKIKAYDVALTAAQIAADYNAERVQFPGQPRITNVKVQPNGFVSFDWVPTPGRTYEVQRTADLTNPNAWEVIASGQTAGSVTNNPGGVNRAYRLRVE